MAQTRAWLTAVKDPAANWVLRLPSRRVRRLFVRRVLDWKIGSEVWIGRGVALHNLRGISIGDRVVINGDVRLDLRGGILIGSDVAIAAGCEILTADHDPQSAVRKYRARSVTIGDRVWLATGVTVLPGSFIGDGCAIAARAVVHGRLDPNMIYGGNPAVAIGPRNHGAQAILDSWLPPLG